MTPVSWGVNALARTPAARICVRRIGRVRHATIEAAELHSPDTGLADTENVVD
jgi:hypothetical protein